jgi:hypothetical protein
MTDINSDTLANSRAEIHRKNKVVIQEFYKDCLSLGIILGIYTHDTFADSLLAVFTF